MDAPTKNPNSPQPSTGAEYTSPIGWAWVIGTVLFLLVVFLGFGYGGGWIG